MTDISQILKAMEEGDQRGAEELLPLVYDELRRMAARKLAREAPGQTLQATALVHEAYLKLTGGEGRHFRGHSHFLAAASEAMRRILIDRARRRKARRHGGGQVRVEFEEADLAMREEDDQLLALDEALEKLAQTDPARADLVKLRYFAGLTVVEIAEVLGLSEPTVKRHWRYARAWLRREMERDPG
jgi:RNA polymerase sigma factor (TIGR02999 family)